MQLVSNQIPLISFFPQHFDFQPSERSDGAIQTPEGQSTHHEECYSASENSCTMSSVPRRSFIKSEKTLMMSNRCHQGYLNTF